MEGHFHLLAALSSAVLMLWAVVLLLFMLGFLWMHRAAVARCVCRFCKRVGKCPLLQFSNLGMCKGVDDEHLRLKIEAAADAQLLERVRNFMPIAGFLMPFQVIINALTAYYIAFEDCEGYLVFRARVFFRVPIEIMAFSFYLKPAAMNKSALRMGYACISARGVYWALTRHHGQAGSETLSGLPDEYEVVFNHLVRLWGGLLLQDTKFLVIAHLFIVPITIAAHLIMDTGEDDVFAHSIAEFLGAIVVCTCCATLERATKASILASLNAQSARALEGAADALLSSVCEAVIHLSPTFQLMKACPRLSALLLKDPTCPLTGGFCDLLMNESDMESFTRFVQVDEEGPSGRDGALARTLHVTMRDANNAPVNVQLFHTTCTGVSSDQVHHLVGIREVGDECKPTSAGDDNDDDVPNNAKEMVRMYRSVPPPAVPSDWLALPLGTIGEETAWESESDCDSQHSGSAVAAWALPKDLTTLDEGAKVWISLLDDIDLPMQRWTAAFTTLFGSSTLSPGANFLDLVPSRRERHKLSKQMQYFVNNLLHAKTEDAESPSRMQLIANTQYLGTVSLIATVQLDLDEGDGESEASDVLNAVIQITSWRRVRRQQHQRKQPISTRRPERASWASSDLLMGTSTMPPDAPCREKNIVSL